MALGSIYAVEQKRLNNQSAKEHNPPRLQRRTRSQPGHQTLFSYSSVFPPGCPGYPQVRICRSFQFLRISRTSGVHRNCHTFESLTACADDKLVAARKATTQPFEAKRRRSRTGGPLVAPGSTKSPPKPPLHYYRLADSRTSWDGVAEQQCKPSRWTFLRRWQGHVGACPKLSIGFADALTFMFHHHL